MLAGASLSIWPSALTSGKSAAVITSLTPSRARAARVSIDLIRAWAQVLRSALPYSMPGREKSAPYWARPVTLSTPSCRIGRLPIQR